MDVTAIEYGTADDLEAVDRVLLESITWANERPADRYADPQWFYAFADVLRAIEAYRQGRTP